MIPIPDEIIFEITDAEEGGYCAKARGYGIFTQGDDWDDLVRMARDAAVCYFDDERAAGVVEMRCKSILPLMDSQGGMQTEIKQELRLANPLSLDGRGLGRG